MSLAAFLLCAWCAAIPCARSLTADEIARGSGVTLRFIGPGNGGSMFGADFQPGNPNIILFGGDMGAMYRTEDGGKRWAIVGGPSGDQPGVDGVWTVVFDRRRPNVVWAGGAGAFKSLDAGATWTSMTRRAFGATPPIGAIAIDPGDSNIVYIAEGCSPRMVLGWARGRVWKTANGGETWRELPRPGGPLSGDSLRQRNYSCIVIDPGSRVIPGEGRATVYLAGRGGLFRSDDAGRSWRDLSAAFAPGQVTNLRLVRKGGRPILFLTATPAMGLAEGGVYRSDDRGETWRPINKGLEPLIKRLRERNKKLAADRNASFFSLLLASSPQAPSRLYAGSWQGIARSDDLGEHWQIVTPPEGTYVKDHRGRYLAVPTNTKVFRKSLWGGIDHFNNLVAAAGDADRLLFTDNQDIYQSLDGARTWNSLTFDYAHAFDPELYPDLPPNRFTYATRSRGVQNIVCCQACVDPFDPKTIYAAYMDLGLEISRDAGETWEHPTRGTPSRGHAWAVVADPQKEGRVYLSLGQKWGQEGGVYRSDDKGRHWRRIGLDNAAMGAVWDILIDPASPVDRRTLYLGAERRGIYKSSDGGRTWSNILSAWKGKSLEVPCLAIEPGSSSIYAGSSAGLLRSADGGKTWVRLGEGLFEKVERISVCRAAPSTLYVCAHLPGRNGYWGETRLWRSNDGGRHFRNITPSFMRWPGAVAVNPFDPNYIYACNNLMTCQGDQKMLIVRSKDAGRTWEDIGAGIAFCRGRRITIDPKNPRHFFVYPRFSLMEGWDRESPLAPPGKTARPAGPQR